MNFDQVTLATRVDVTKQLKPSQYVSFDGAEKPGLRVMFVGNSITLHGVNLAIGWPNFWGMAASAPEKDYVHLCCAHIRKTHPQAAFCICQAGDWERQYAEGDRTFPEFAAARDFGADVIIIKLAGNCPVENFDGALFQKNFASLIGYLNSTGRAQVIVATEFYRHPARDAIRRYAEESGCPLCVLDDLGDRPEMKAIGLFAHEGVANHPGDLGMQTIAGRLCAVFDTMEAARA